MSICIASRMLSKFHHSMIFRMEETMCQTWISSECDPAIITNKVAVKIPHIWPWPYQDGLTSLRLVCSCFAISRHTEWSFVSIFLQIGIILLVIMFNKHFHLIWTTLLTTIWAAIYDSLSLDLVSFNLWY